MSTDFIKTIAEVILAIGVIALSIGYAVAQLRQGKNTAARDLAATLEELLKARDIKVSDLENVVKEQGNKIAHLEGIIETLYKKKTDMETLIKTALKEHFATHPDMAQELVKKGLKTS